MKRLAIVFGVVFLGVASSVAAQPPARAGRGAVEPGAEPGVSPAEVQRMFDAYALMQAQEQLNIGEGQFSSFLTRFKALQDVRRRTLQERVRVTNELRRLLNQGNGDEGQIRERLKALQDISARGAEDERKAYDAIDQVLDVRQQARFRIFEEVMDRRKLDLVARARLANRPKNQR
jgi:Spy/CpxP family protein refolding chaperone